MIRINYKNKKFILISDTHGLHENLTITECDFIIHCGDVCTFGNIDEIKSFFDWFSKLPAKNKLFISGNHDFCFIYESNQAELLLPKNITFLENRVMIIDGIYFYGISSQYNLYEMPEIQKYPIDFVLTHIPPKSILDDNLGCSYLFDFIKIQQPKYHIFGHIHKYGQQIKKSNDTVFINASCLVKYKVIPKIPEILNKTIDNLNLFVRIK